MIVLGDCGDGMNDYHNRFSQMSLTESQMVSENDGVGDHNYQGTNWLIVLNNLYLLNFSAPVV